jgi:hypothetical protein
MNNQVDITPDDAWPGVANAYDFVLPSYHLLTGRFEAADNRLTSLLTFTANITLGVPIFAKAVRPDITFDSLIFVWAVCVGAFSVIVGAIGRGYGVISLPSPEVLYDHALRESPWEFKKNAVFYAGKHFAANADAIKAKASYAHVMIVALVIEVFSFIVWLAARTMP